MIFFSIFNADNLHNADYNSYFCVREYSRNALNFMIMKKKVLELDSASLQYLQDLLSHRFSVVRFNSKLVYSLYGKRRFSDELELLSSLLILLSDDID